MKLENPLKCLLTMLLILLMASICLVSCKAKKTTIASENVKDSSRYVVATTFNKEVNKAVADSIAKIIPLLKTGNKDCDSLCNEKYIEALEQINFHKRSGGNNYKLYFDKEKRLLSFVANLEQTITELQTKSEIKERYFVKTKTITKTELKPVNKFGFLDWFGLAFIAFLGWRVYRIFT